MHVGSAYFLFFFICSLFFLHTSIPHATSAFPTTTAALPRAWCAILGQQARQRRCHACPRLHRRGAKRRRRLRRRPRIREGQHPVSVYQGGREPRARRAQAARARGAQQAARWRADVHV